MLGELATTNAARVTEYKARKTRYDQRTFRRDESEFATLEGWELVRENQSSDRYQKLKPHYEQLENEFWCLLYNFGYPNLNVGRNFQIEVTSNKRVTVSKVGASTISSCKRYAAICATLFQSRDRWTSRTFLGSRWGW
jgi:hypothetical protein